MYVISLNYAIYFAYKAAISLLPNSWTNFSGKGRGIFPAQNNLSQLLHTKWQADENQAAGKQAPAPEKSTPSRRAATLTS